MTERIIGYHGTTKENAEIIILQQKMKPSTGYDEWLSRGIYFFTQVGDAKWWCSQRNYKEHSIIVADMECEEDFILNLVDDLEDIEMFSEVCMAVKDKSPRLPDGTRRKNYMQLAIDRMRYVLRVKFNKDIFMAKALFKENRKTKLKSVHFDKFPIVYGQIQICVYNHDIIKSITRM